MSGEIININEWIDNHDLVFGVGIIDDPILENIAREAIHKRRMVETRNDIKVFQNYNNLIDYKTNNAGVIDINTFYSLIDIFNYDQNKLCCIRNRIKYNVNKFNGFVNNNKKHKINIFKRIKLFIGKFFIKLPR